MSFNSVLDIMKGSRWHMAINNKYLCAYYLSDIVHFMYMKKACPISNKVMSAEPPLSCRGPIWIGTPKRPFNKNEID